MHNMQLFAGMYGALIVKDPEQKYDEEKNKVLLLSENMKFDLLINGKKDPDTLYLKKGMSYHLRLINISFGWSFITTSIIHNGLPVNWKALAKDGADLPSHQQLIKPAFKQPVSIGQTFDFEFKPEETGDYLFQITDDMYNALPRPVIKVIRVKE
jgi:manganese oxidase